MSLIEQRFKQFEEFIKSTLSHFSDLMHSPSGKVSEISCPYESVSDYKKKEGKHFRRNSEEMALGLSPEESLRRRFSS
tara:strand:- start:1158 stop:1391 length:234 start_codon:yes stop_codon:yes gene_type:complete